MLKKIILLFIAVAPFLLHAQITITAQVPPAGLVSKDYLWNLVLTNTKDGLLNLYIRINVQDPASGEILMSANSSGITLGRGVKVITSRDVQPVAYNYYAQDFSRAYLPIGAYIICYQVYHGEDVLNEQCVRINIDPLSPPLLNSPTDQSMIETPYPQFTWMPPTAIDMFSDLTYDILVTEVLEGQAPVDAIQYNAPIYSRTDIKQPSESYPSGFTALETDKTYAWQIIAKNERSYAAKSETWLFRVKPPAKINSLVDRSPYLRMKKSGSEKGIAPNGILKLSYINETTDSIATVRIIDRSSENKSVPSFRILLKVGENLIQYDLKQIINTGNGNVYEAEIINSRNERWVSVFETRNYDDK